MVYYTNISVSKCFSHAAVTYIEANGPRSAFVSRNVIDNSTFKILAKLAKKYLKKFVKFTGNTMERRPRTEGKNLWYRFQILAPSVAILRGSFAMNDPHFKQRSRGQQAAPCSVVAIVFGRLFEPKDWTKNFVDQILEYGDKLFRISVTRNRVKSGTYITTKLVHPEFYIDDYKCLTCVEDSNVFGNLFSASIGCPDFMDGLQRFLKANDSGVITAQGNSVAVWRHPSGFLYYDPGPCGEGGLRSKDGSACVMRFKKIEELGELFLKNMNKQYDSRYCIDRVNVLRVTLINRGVLSENLKDQLVVDQNVLRALNPMDVDENKLDCTQSAPKRPKRPKPSTTSRAIIQKEPLTITISNYNIDARFATEPLVDFKTLDTGYPYYDMEVNVPSTFKELSSKMAILHGWTHEGSEMYKGKGAQNVANCAMSIAMKKVHPVKTWLRPKLDEVLVLGDALYSTVKSEKPSIKSLTAADLDDTQIKIEDKKMFIDVDVLTIIGTINSKIPEVLSLKQALEEFFLVNTNGIVESSSMAIAVWTQDDYYYTFDPRQCDASGVRIADTKGKGKGGKKDAGPQEKIVKGKCCVVRFSDIDSLVALFLKNVPPAKKNDRFIVRNMTVADDIPGTRAWKEFQPGEAGKTWILRGGVSNVDEGFEPESQGVQGIAMPIVALVNAKDTPPCDWTKETVDEAVRDGDKYFNWCVPPEEEENRKLMMGNLKKSLYVKNRKVQVDLEEASVVGDLKVSGESEMLSLDRGLKQFFEGRQFGVVEVKDLSVAVWKFEEEQKDKTKQAFYYYCDSNPRGALGQRDVEGEEDEPVACVVRAVDPAELAGLIEKNIDPEEESGDDFVIHEVKILSIGEPMTEDEIERDKAIPLKPDLNFYTELGEDGACLNGSLDQSNEMAFKQLTRGKQQAANALVALGMKKLYNPHLWYREVVDDVLKVGDQVTQKNIENLPEEEEEGEASRNYLRPSEIGEDFEIGVNRVTVALEEEVSTGALNDLANVLEDFFKDNSMGIFRLEDVMLPVWKEGSVYFTMDPRGRDNQGVPKETEGAATVLWFTNVPSLASSLKLAVNKPNQDFVIDAVTLENAYESRLAPEERPKKTTSGEELWHNFPKLKEGVWQFTGNVSMADERFEQENRNKQSAAVAVMAIIFSKAYEPRQWSSEVLDEVVVSGDKLHSQCVARLGESSPPRVNEITKEFFLSNRRIDLTIEDCVQAGDLAGKPPKVQDLKTGLEKFFAKHDSGALTLFNDTNIAVWKYGDFYFSLIPGADSSGDEGTSGLPKISRFANLDAFSEYLKDVLGNEGDYVVTAIDVVDWNKQPPWKYDPSSAVRPSNLPPLNAYQKLKGLQGTARAILRGGAHQGSEVFPEEIQNRQTAANCVVALGMSVVKNPVTWTKKTLDEILVMGSDVHRQTQKARPQKQRFQPKDIVRVFHVGVNVLTADVEDSTISGPVAIPPPEPEVKGKGKGKAKKPPKAKKAKKGKQKRVPPPPPPPVYLEEGLNRFLEKNRAGILSTGRYMVAVWKDQGVYFMYDPRSRGATGSQEDNGTSCTMWFACLEPLYDLIFANIDDDEKYGRYEMCRVIVRTTLIEALPCPAGFRPVLQCDGPSLPISSSRKSASLDVEVLTEYNIVDDELSVLRGTLHMNDPSFGVKSRGLQSTAIAAVAIVVGLLHVPSTWTSELVDAVLKYGDVLHTDSTRAIRPGARTLSPSELLTVFIVGDFRANISIHNHTTAGVLQVFDLATSLDLLFRNNCAGILHTSNVAVAVMQHYGKFYLFDPCARNEVGRPSFGGAACVMKCESTERLASQFVTNYNYKAATVYTLNAVDVLDLQFFSDSRSQCPPICNKNLRS